MCHLQVVLHPFFGAALPGLHADAHVEAALYPDWRGGTQAQIGAKRSGKCSPVAAAFHFGELVGDWSGVGHVTALGNINERQYGILLPVVFAVIHG